MKPIEHAPNEFKQLIDLMDRLRKECPWDRKQTIQSLQKYSIEELYELVDAIHSNNMDEVKEELGDILFHTVFYSKIASETNDFTITDVLVDVREKLERRHPHIFGDVAVENEEDVKRNWEAIKIQEGKDSVLSGVPRSLPALIKAFRIQEKAAQVGFDWKEKQQVWEKVKEEIAEFEVAKENELPNELEEEFGDILFSLINYARFLKLDPEMCLEKTNRKFISRFQFMESEFLKLGKQMSDASLNELEQYWQRAKAVEKT